MSVTTIFDVARSVSAQRLRITQENVVRGVEEQTRRVQEIVTGHTEVLSVVEGRIAALEAKFAQEREANKALINVLSSRNTQLQETVNQLTGKVAVLENCLRTTEGVANKALHQVNNHTHHLAIKAKTTDGLKFK